MDMKLLKSKIIAFGETSEKLAEYLDISSATLSYKINGKSDFTRKEIMQIKERYQLTPKEVDDIFFTTQVS